jgi:decaprenylphospho-beta-D-ribofuranose 2-oxidase
MRIIDASGQNSCNPYEIRQIHSIVDIRQAVNDAKTLNKKIIMFGCKHSQAGQICYDDAIALDMNGYNRILSLDVEAKQITVESGIQWKDIQEAIDPHHLALQVMQFVNTFTVAGSMSANIFSRDPRRGRLIEVIKRFTLIDANGAYVYCSREKNSELFHLVIEGHGLFGTIAEVTIQLVPNTLFTCRTVILSPQDYLKSTLHSYRKNPGFAYQHAQYTLDENDFMQRIISTNFYEGPLAEHEDSSLTRHELMTMTRERELTFWNPVASDALLGFFIPIKSFLKFQTSMQSILQQTPLDVFKCSVNYLPTLRESFLFPSLGPCMKFALFYRHEAKRNQAADALKEQCAEATLRAGGAPYLTFDFKATAQQMDAFYPSWRAFLAKKRDYDPQEIFYNRFYQRLKAKG